MSRPVEGVAANEDHLRDDAGDVGRPDTSLIGQAWAAAAAGDEAPAPLRVTGPSGHLRSRLPVEEAPDACAGAALLAARATERLHREALEHVDALLAALAPGLPAEDRRRRGVVCKQVGKAFLPSSGPPTRPSASGS
jgi:hypothetical protein